jgi:hypothetical protein
MVDRDKYSKDKFCANCQYGTDRLWGRFCKRPRLGLSYSLQSCEYEREGTIPNDLSQYESNILDSPSPRQLRRRAKRIGLCGQRAHFFEIRICPT